MNDVNWAVFHNHLIWLFNFTCILTRVMAYDRSKVQTIPCQFFTYFKQMYQEC